MNKLAYLEGYMSKEAGVHIPKSLKGKRTYQFRKLLNEAEELFKQENKVYPADVVPPSALEDARQASVGSHAVKLTPEAAELLSPSWYHAGDHINPDDIINELKHLTGGEGLPAGGRRRRVVLEEDRRRIFRAMSPEGKRDYPEVSQGFADLARGLQTYIKRGGAPEKGLLDKKIARNKRFADFLKDMDERLKAIEKRKAAAE